MRISCNDPFWVVLDPTAESTLPDVLFETTLVGLELQFRGGLTCDRHPAIFLDPVEAKAEAAGRLLARDIARQVAQKAGAFPLDQVRHVVLKNADGEALLEVVVSPAGEGS